MKLLIKKIPQLDLYVVELSIADQEMASLGPGRCSRYFAILDVGLLRLRLQNSCGLDLNLNLPFLDGQLISINDLFSDFCVCFF